ncbi:MAG TPA: HAD family hydrolase [Ilumatobacter sp.]|nr:HAD family hydrolase [Ilumatobacter sp.]
MMPADDAPKHRKAVTVAAFDFDETLTRQDTVVPFLRRLAGGRTLALGVLARSHRLASAAMRRNRDALRAMATDQVFRGRSIHEVEEHAREYGDQIYAVGLRPDTAARLAWHREAGHRVVIVSASYEQYVHVVGAHLGVDAVLATRLEVESERCTGRLLGPNCRGPEKVARLRGWLDAEGLSLDDVTLWAYGDSGGDRELLAAAQHPHWVRTPLDSVSPAV